MIQLDTDCFRNKEEVEIYLKSQIAKVYPTISFVKIGINIDNQTSTISCFFDDVPIDGEAITLFMSRGDIHYNLPILPILEDRVKKVQQICRKFIGVEYKC